MISETGLDFLLYDQSYEIDGVSCGEYIKVYCTSRNGLVYFHFYCEACSVAGKAARTLAERLNGRKAADIVEYINSVRSGDALSGDDVHRQPPTRRDCALAPLLLLEAAIIGLQAAPYAVNEKLSPLACDACVRSCGLNSKETTDAKPGIDTFSNNMKELRITDGNENLHSTAIMRMGKIVVNKSDISAFSSLPEVDLSVIKKLKLAPFIYANLKTHNTPVPCDLETLVNKQVISTRFAEREVLKILSFIENNNMSVYQVKGAYAKRYYPNGLICQGVKRTFLA